MAEIELGIMESELIQALEQALSAEDNPDGALTTRELAELMDWHPQTIIKALRRLKRSECLESCKVHREDLSGRITRVPAYRLKQASN